MRLPQNLRGTVATLALAAMAVAPLSAALTVLSVDTAYAGNHTGNGNGNGNGNSDRGNAGNGNGRADAGRPANPGGNGRGAVASELGALNAAHANQQALENAAPESMPGRLYSYQQTGGITSAEVADYNAAQTELTRLQDLSQSELVAAYDADGDGALSAAELDVYAADIAAAKTVIDTYQDAYAALSALRDGNGQMQLTASALAELNALLGL